MIAARPILADAPAPSPEAPRASDDGMIWPVERHKMRDREQIIARMIEDFKAIGREKNAVFLRDLRDRGWGHAQAKVYHLAAVLRLREDEAEEAAP